MKLGWFSETKRRNGRGVGGFPRVTANALSRAFVTRLTRRERKQSGQMVSQVFTVFTKSVSNFLNFFSLNNEFHT